jgi:hypothetical protein
VGGPRRIRQIITETSWGHQAREPSSSLRFRLC